MTTRTCENCTHWDRGQNYQGLCRRWPVRYKESWPLTSKTDWCGEHKKSSEKKEKAPPNPDTNKLVGIYMRTFQEIHNTEPMITAKDRKAAKDLVTKFGLNKASEIVESFLHQPPKWNRDNGALGLVNIPGAANKILVRG